MINVSANDIPTLASIFKDNMLLHDVADEAGDEDTLRVQDAIIMALEGAASSTPCRDAADVAHRIACAFGLMGSIYSKARSGESVETETAADEEMLRRAMDGLEAVTGYNRDDYRLDYYIARPA